MFRRFRAHYGCRVKFCNPYAGYEKGNVERKVGYVRANLFVPVPRVKDFHVYNRELLKRHDVKAQETHYRAEAYRQQRLSHNALYPDEESWFLGEQRHPPAGTGTPEGLSGPAGPTQPQKAAPHACRAHELLWLRDRIDGHGAQHRWRASLVP